MTYKPGHCLLDMMSAATFNHGLNRRTPIHPRSGQITRKTRIARRSLRELKESANRGLRAWGAAFGKPEVADRLCTEVAPKRAWTKRPGATEYQEQGAVIEWWWTAHKSYQLPVFALFSVPNGSYLASGYAGAAILKKTGMRNGAPDLNLAAPRREYHGLYIEMKSEKGRESDEQREFGGYLETVGYRFSFCYGAEPAIALIKEYLA